jgi:Zn-dependent M28 family amino/carboxypeptidase
VKRQVELGPRPAGSAASRALGERIRRTLPRGRFEPVPGGLRNVVGIVRGRNPRRVVVVGAHYDTKAIPGFVGANDGAAGTAILTQLARTIKPRRARSTLVFIAFDGEELPPGRPEDEFERYALRGSKAIAPAYRDAKAMVLLDFVGQRGLRIPRESNSDIALWAKLRRAARRTGFGRVFPEDTQGAITDDHIPFIRRGVPSIDLIDFDYPCFHRTCDDLSQISRRSLDAVGETMMQLLPRL